MFLNVINNNFTFVSDEYKIFNNNKLSCTKCSVFHHYKNVVPSEGNAQNPIFVFIGESPGADEIENNRPFIGKAGQRLRMELKKYNKVFNKNTSLITNLMPCRPINNKFPKDNIASLEVNGEYEVYYDLNKKTVKASKLIEHCYANWLEKELKILKPKVIVTLGSNSLEYITGEKGITINRGFFRKVDKFNCYVYSTYHPSYILRCENDNNKQNVVLQFNEDIKKISEEYSQL